MPETEKSTEPPCLCDVCGIDMRDEETGKIVYGLSIHVGKCKEADRLIEIFGKADFEICFPCWVKSLGVKPKGK